MAAAVVVLAGIVAVASVLNRGGGSGVAWAEMIKQVEEATDCICRVQQRNTGDPEVEMVRYQSAKYGIRIDMYRDGRMVANQYLEKNSDELIVMVSRERLEKLEGNWTGTRPMRSPAKLPVILHRRLFLDRNGPVDPSCR